MTLWSELDPDGLVTRSEAAELLAVTTRTIDRYVASGALVAYQIAAGGRRRRFYVRDVRALLVSEEKP